MSRYEYRCERVNVALLTPSYDRLSQALVDGWEPYAVTLVPPSTERHHLRRLVTPETPVYYHVEHDPGDEQAPALLERDGVPPLVYHGLPDFEWEKPDPLVNRWVFGRRGAETWFSATFDSADSHGEGWYMVDERFNLKLAVFHDFDALLRWVREYVLHEEEG